MFVLSYVTNVTTAVGVIVGTGDQLLLFLAVAGILALAVASFECYFLSNYIFYKVNVNAFVDYL